jgi:heme-degrading monooxygenase HmoA
MIFERAELSIKEGLETEFASAMRERGIAVLKAVPGVKTVKFGRGVENPGKFMLLVEWESMAAHGTYNGTPAQNAFRAVIGPFSKGGAMEHFDME